MTSRTPNSYQLYAPHRQSSAAAPANQDAAHAAHAHARADAHARRAVSATVTVLTPELSVSRVGKSHLRDGTKPHDCGGRRELCSLSHVELRSKRYLKLFPTAAQYQDWATPVSSTETIGKRQKRKVLVSRGFRNPQKVKSIESGRSDDLPLSKKAYWHAVCRVLTGTLRGTERILPGL